MDKAKRGSIQRNCIACPVINGTHDCGSHRAYAYHNATTHCDMPACQTPMPFYYDAAKTGGLLGLMSKNVKYVSITTQKPIPWSACRVAFRTTRMSRVIACAAATACGTSF
jgi:hypothetical protein